MLPTLSPKIVRAAFAAGFLAASFGLVLSAGQAAAQGRHAAHYYGRYGAALHVGRAGYPGGEWVGDACDLPTSACSNLFRIGS